MLSRFRAGFEGGLWAAGTAGAAVVFWHICLREPLRVGLLTVALDPQSRQGYTKGESFHWVGVGPVLARYPITYRGVS